MSETFSAGEVAVLVENGRSIQLNVLRVETTDQRLTILDVVKQTLRHKWIFIEIDQMSSLTISVNAQLA